MGENEIKQLK